MRVGKTTEKEIQSVFDFMNELSWLCEELRFKHFEHVDWDEFPIMKQMDTNDPEQLISDLAQYAKNCFYERVLTNCTILLENCTDPDLKYLDFKPDIKKALQQVDNPKQSKLKQALHEKIAEFETYKTDKRYQTHIEQNAVVVTLRELRYLDSIVEYEETSETQN